MAILISKGYVLNQTPPKPCSSIGALVIVSQSVTALWKHCE